MDKHYDERIVVFWLKMFLRRNIILLYEKDAYWMEMEEKYGIPNNK